MTSNLRAAVKDAAVDGETIGTTALIVLAGLMVMLWRRRRKIQHQSAAIEVLQQRCEVVQAQLVAAQQSQWQTQQGQGPAAMQLRALNAARLVAEERAETLAHENQQLRRISQHLWQLHTKHEKDSSENTISLSPTQLRAASME